jgi:hypothetical protein
VKIIFQISTMMHETWIGIENCQTMTNFCVDCSLPTHLNIFLLVYKSIISSFSKAPSNFCNSSSKFTSIPISFERLGGDLQPTLQSLG